MKAKKVLAAAALICVSCFCLLLIGAPSLFFDFPSGGNAQSGGVNLPRVGVIAALQNGAAAIECVNGGSSDDELHIVLRSKGRIIEEQMQALSPHYMARMALNLAASESADNLSLRIGRPAGGSEPLEPATNCWVITQSTTPDGQPVLASIPLAAEGDVCAPLDYAAATENASEGGQNSNSSLLKMVPFSTARVEGFPGDVQNSFLLNVASQSPAAVSLHLELHDETGALLQERDYQVAPGGEEWVRLTDLVDGRTSQGYLTVKALDGDPNYVSVRNKRQLGNMTDSEPAQTSPGVELSAIDIEVQCTPNCEGAVCGDDGCGGSCGSCDPGQTCEDGQCSGCVPQCDGKQCGDDGCGGDCGSCDPGQTCEDGQCSGCVPQCDGKQCGDDGCGGDCGVCDPGQTCEDGQCGCLQQCDGKQCGDDSCGGTCPPGCPDGESCDEHGQCAAWPACGDGICQETETPCTCEMDCGPCANCPDGTCNGDESCDSCPQDCGDCPGYCGDNVCQPEENCHSCPNDCTWWWCPGECGDGYCDGGEDCHTCQLDCDGCCGNAICDDGEDCWNCESDCGGCGPICGENGCEDGEDCGNCPQDCGGCGWCGDGDCGWGEDEGNCPLDCGCMADECEPGKCGPNPCGGWCGCEDGLECLDGTCVMPCVVAGADGAVAAAESNCGCPGGCASNEVCLDGQCKPNACGDPCSTAGNCAEGDWRVIDEHAWLPVSQCTEKEFILLARTVVTCEGTKEETTQVETNDQPPRPVPDEPPKGCDDGDDRTTGDKCVGGVCQGTCEGPDCGGNLCGNGMIDEGEECDPPDNNGCGSDCKYRTLICGDGTCGYPAAAAAMAAGDGAGESGEDCQTCPQDCGTCPCEPDCTDKQCGSDGCDGSCGECDIGLTCSSEGHCVGCEPDCTNKCGGDPDDCGGTCPDPCSGQACNAGQCGCQPNCDGKCGGEWNDCDDWCPDPCPGQACNAGQCGCQPNCDGKCGGEWNDCDGWCPDPCSGQACNAGQCGCEPNCDGKCWGSEDGCGGYCWISWCSWDEVCVGDRCCRPDCGGKQCGDDACGGSCGECQWDETCNFGTGQCERNCEPNCNNKCGGEWNDCDGWCPDPCPGQACNAGQCECLPDCWGKECGSDGCGSSCGECAADRTCTPEGRCEPINPCGTCAPNEICNPDTGECVGNECNNPGDCGECAGDTTGWTCDRGVCIPRNDVRPCNDDNLCTEDSCKVDERKCEHTPKTCAENETCDSATGECVGTECSNPGDCGECAGDTMGWTCDRGVCIPRNDARPCNDNDLCTDDVCIVDERRCEHPAKTCAENETCDSATGECVGTECNDPGDCGECAGDTMGWTCDRGVCIPRNDARPCNDNDLCTDDVCIVDERRCDHPAKSCPDGEECNPNSGNCERICSCNGRECGDDGCGSSCGECTADQICNPEGYCESICVRSCTGKQCGDDGCGDPCPPGCPEGEVCTDDGRCVAVPPCGDGFCDPASENCENCAQDCGECPTCGDGSCNNDELCQTCPEDCGPCGGTASFRCAGSWAAETGETPGEPAAVSGTATLEVTQGSESSSINLNITSDPESPNNGWVTDAVELALNGNEAVVTCTGEISVSLPDTTLSGTFQYQNSFDGAALAAAGNQTVFSRSAEAVRALPNGGDQCSNVGDVIYGPTRQETERSFPEKLAVELDREPA